MELESSLNNVCRTCLSSEILDTCYLFENTYYNNICLGEILFNCCAIQTDTNASCKYICLGCKTQLLSFYKFKKQCEETDAVLKSSYAKNKFTSKSSDITIEELKIKEEIEAEELSVAGDCTDTFEETQSEVSESEEIIKESSNENIKECRKEKSLRNLKVNIIDKPTYQCTICSEQFKKLIYLEQHVLTHESATPFICKECGKCFQKYKNLTVHQKLHTGQKPYLCTICGRSFALSGNLKAHLRIHSGVKPYSCQECGKSFTQWSSLRSHLVCHSGERSYVCAICGKTFTRAGILSRHMTTHSEEKKYPCNLCNKRFKNSSQRARHLIIHTDEKKYKCAVCGKAFNRSSNLNVHQKIHSGVRPHGCPICGKRFIQLHCLKSHMNTHC